MAEDAPEKERNESKNQGGGGALKAALMVAAVLALEVGTIAGTMYLSGGPVPVKGQTLRNLKKGELNEIVEVKVVEGRFPNRRTGRTYLYDMEIYLTVRKADLKEVKEALKARSAHIRTGVRAIVASASPKYFREPTLATLRRQIKNMLRKYISKETTTSPDEQPLVRDVLITRCIPFLAN